MVFDSEYMGALLSEMSNRYDCEQGYLPLDQCIRGPPPDGILSIPPPPMPSLGFLYAELAKNATTGPCSMLCDINNGQSVEMKELHHKGAVEEDSWFSGMMVLILVVLLLASMAIVLFKYRQSKKVKLTTRKKKFNNRTYESILYPPTQEPFDLWATFAASGKLRHVAAQPPPLPPRINQAKSFENDAFNNSEEYPGKHRHPKVSSPQNIENLNVPPLNNYPNMKRQQSFI